MGDVFVECSGNVWHCRVNDMQKEPKYIHFQRNVYDRAFATLLLVRHLFQEPPRIRMVMITKMRCKIHKDEYKTFFEVG